MIVEHVQELQVPEGIVKNFNIEGLPSWSRPQIYGVSWDKTNTATLTRTHDSATFSTPKIGKGSTIGSSPFDSCYPWSHIKPVADGSNQLVSIPKFWYRWQDTGTALTLQIADKQVSGFNVSPMHADRGDGFGEREVCYIGRYKCAADYRSKSGVSTITSISMDTARSKIKALGSGYYQQDYAAFWTLRMLFLVEWATWDGQSVLENTADYASVSSYVTGSTSSMAYHTGISANGYSVAYRYVEDPWENLLEWMDGIYFSGAKTYCIANPQKFSSSTGGTLIGSRSTGTGYIKSWGIPTASGFEWALYPTSVNSSIGYVQDGYYYTSTGTVMYIGGARASWELHGPFFMYCDFTASQTSSVIGCRLMKLP